MSALKSHTMPTSISPFSMLAGIGADGEEALLLGKLGEEVDGRLQVLFAAAQCNRRRQHQRIGLRRLADIADRHLVVAGRRGRAKSSAGSARSW